MHRHSARGAYTVLYDVYIQASQLEKEGRLSEAEQLYVLVNEPDTAISMYKKAKQVTFSVHCTVYGDQTSDYSQNESSLFCCLV